MTRTGPGIFEFLEGSNILPYQPSSYHIKYINRDVVKITKIEMLSSFQFIILDLSLGLASSTPLKECEKPTPKSILMAAEQVDKFKSLYSSSDSFNREIANELFNSIWQSQKTEKITKKLFRKELLEKRKKELGERNS